MTDRNAIEQAIAVLETQRAILGDAVVDASLAALRAQLATSTPPIEQQRKLATILFADVSGFTALSETLDSEDVTAIMNALWERLDMVVLHAGGRVDKHIGDAIMALWGADSGREDDPERAVRAALTMQLELAAFRKERGLKLAMRIGVNTGPVLLGNVGSTREFTAMGDAVNLASRMEHAAPVGGILITHDTHRHIRGLFEVTPQEPITVKGKREPIQTYLVRAAKARAFHMPTRGVEGVETHMIGREAELLTLQGTYRDATEGGETCMVTVVGDAGVGKSRLLSELEAWIGQRSQPTTMLRGRATLEILHRSGGLLRDLLGTYSSISDTDDQASVRQKLTAALAPTLSVNEAGVLGQAASFDFGDVPVVQAAVGGTGFTQMAAAYLATWLRGLSDHHPVVLLLEDLHWADDRSLDLLDAALARLTGCRLLLIGLTRPTFFERRPDWGAGQTHFTRLDLRPLSARAGRELVNEILQRVVEIPESLRDLIVTNAEGNPFYIEELIKMLIEQKVITHGADTHADWLVHLERLGGMLVPATLAGVLQARLDSLPANEKTMLQQASVVGRAFWDAAVAALAQKEDITEVSSTLGGLRARELVFRRERSTFAEVQEYVFKHALLREVTYESVLKRLRRDYHLQAAHWLERAAGVRVEEYAALIADHYALTEDVAAEGIWQLRAGKQAAAQHDHDEALRRLSRGLELLPTDDHATRYNVLLVRENVYRLRGVRDAQANDLQELENLAKMRGDIACRVEVMLSWSGHYYWETGNYSTMIGIAHEALQIARTIGDRYSEGEALRILGLAYYSTGEVQNMMHFYEQSLMIWREINRPIGLGDALVMIGLGYYLLGDFQTAVTFCEQALGIVREISARIDEVNALTCLGIIAHVQGNQQAARQLLEEALALARSIGAMIMEVWARIDLGHVLIALGEYDQGTGMFQAAVVLCLTLRHAGLLAEARAGLARTFHIQHRLPEALEQVELVLEHLVTGTLDGADSVMRAYLCCYEVLHAADDPRACSLLERAHTELMVQARRLDETAQQMFLENVPWNREVVAAWVALEG